MQLFNVSVTINSNMDNDPLQRRLHIGLSHGSVDRYLALLLVENRSSRRSLGIIHGERS